MSEPVRLDIHDLLRIMATLLAPGGCPWDREQNHRSLIPYLVEETYEVIEAIEDNDDAEMCVELGDLLLQIVFHAQLASERQVFDFTDVTDAISQKLIRRHPHVFKPEEAVGVDTPEKVLANWERLKRKERGDKASALQGIPRGLPALVQAQRTQDKAASVGFDWDFADAVLDKVQEEVGELRETLDQPERKAEEFGDLLFAMVNLGRHLKLNAEDCLRASTAKFRRRFQAMEGLGHEAGKQLSELDDAGLDALWETVKQQEKQGDAGLQH